MPVGDGKGVPFIMKKAAWLIIIALSIYGYLLLNNPAEWIENLGYNRLLNIYADYRLQHNHIKILYNPGLRPMPVNLEQAAVKAFVPPYHTSYQQMMKDFLQSDSQVIVECSALDNWHSSREGSCYLNPLWEKAYRVVVFDGGHHLPTLGLSPDIIIVPVYKGYAAHGYMRDGMKVSALLELLEKTHSSSILVAVSRWDLVKTEDSLQGIAKQTLRRLEFSHARPDPLVIQCKPRISKYGLDVFIYVAGEYTRNADLLVKRCRQLGIQDVDEVLVAFDYAGFSREQAEQYRKNLQKRLGLKVTTVNQPVKVTDLLFMNE